MKTIIIDGVTYIETEKIESHGNYVITRSNYAGVHAGNIQKRIYTESGLSVILKNARRIWYWEGAATLSQLSQDGVCKPDRCRFTCEVPTIEIIGVCEIIPVSEKAEKSIKSVPVWESLEGEL